jgi:hypothetical protein
MDRQMPERVMTARARARGQVVIVSPTQSFFKNKNFSRCRYLLSQYQWRLKDWNRWRTQPCPANGYSAIIVGMENLLIEQGAVKGYVSFTKETGSVSTAFD